MVASVQRSATSYPDRQPLHVWSSALVVAVLLLLVGCGAQRPAKVPGETDIEVSEVTIRAPNGKSLTVDYAPLLQRLGMRADSLVLPGRYYGPFREAEDRRRVIAFWQTYGYFDVQVDEPLTLFADDEKSVAITWLVTENTRYPIASVHLLHAPEAYDEQLQELIPFSAGEQQVDLERFRKVRIAMAERLRNDGFAHAMVYSRAFVDRSKKSIHWYYYVDAGPPTHVGAVVVDGNVKIPAELIIERAGFHPGEDYDNASRLQAEFDLLDTGAFSSAFIRPKTDTKFIIPGDAPDTGGVLRPEQVDDEGNLVLRELSPAVDLKIHVVEAPSQQFRVRAGAEFDPTRFDTALRSKLWLRNLFGPLHHVTIEGRVGYGWFWRRTGRNGLYGDAQVRYVRPGLLLRLLDFRLTGRFRQLLYPGFGLREVTAGPGVRSTLAAGLFFDVDLLFRYGKQLSFGPFDAATRDSFSLADDDEALGVELQSSLVWDRRDNPVETLSGHLLAARVTYSPGHPLGTNRYLSLSPEARGFIPLTPSFSLGARTVASWVLAAADSGVPLGPRLFGGGSWGMRGYGRDQLSPRAPSCPPPPLGPPVCANGLVGGLSLFETAMEARWLPPLKPFGAVLFTDLGGAGARYNPFAEGLSVALGLGLRLRFWYLPMALDLSYRLVAKNALQLPEDEPFLVFFRVGEAF